MPVDMDHAAFWDAYPKLKASLSRIPGTAAAQTSQQSRREPE